MINPLFIWIAIGTWIALATYIAGVAKKGMGEGISEFFIGGRRLSGFVSAMTYSATTYSAFMLVGLVGLTYKSGVGALGFEMTYLIFTVLLLIVFAPRFWVAGRKFDYVTPPELLSGRYQNKWAGIVSSVISLVMLIPYSSVQLMGVGILINGLSGGEIPYYVGIIIMASFSCFAALWAGMRSVSWTDAFQAITMLVSALIALFYIFFHFFGSPLNFFVDFAGSHPELLKLSWPPGRFIGLALPWAFFALTNPQVSQRMFVPDSTISLKRMIIYFSFFGFIYTIISTMFGFQAASIIPSLSNPDRAMASLLTNIPVPLALLIFVGIFAAATSTLGSIVLTLSSLFSRDVIRNLAPKLEEESELNLGKLSIPVILSACVGFALKRPGLIAVLSSMASGGLLVMAPALIGTFFWKKATAAGAVTSMTVGGLMTGVMYVWNIYPLGWWPSVWGFLVTVFLFISVSLLTEPPENREDFFHSISEELSEKGFN